MDKLRIGLALLLLGYLGWRVWPNLRARIPDDFQKLSGPQRVQRARVNHEATLREKYRAAGVTYPGEIFVRWLKHEASLELWARNGTEPFRLVAGWPILASSGKPGPKRREGDYQVPEGFYEIDRFNPESLFHVARLELSQCFGPGAQRSETTRQRHLHPREGRERWLRPDRR